MSNKRKANSPQRTDSPVPPWGVTLQKDLKVEMQTLFQTVPPWGVTLQDDVNQLKTDMSGLKNAVQTIIQTLEEIKNHINYVAPPVPASGVVVAPPVSAPDAVAAPPVADQVGHYELAEDVMETGQAGDSPTGGHRVHEPRLLPVTEAPARVNEDVLEEFAAHEDPLPETYFCINTHDDLHSVEAMLKEKEQAKQDLATRLSNREYPVMRESFLFSCLDYIFSEVMADDIIFLGAGSKRTKHVFYDSSLYSVVLEAAKKKFSRAECKSYGERNTFKQDTDHEIQSWILARKSRSISTPNIHRPRDRN